MAVQRRNTPVTFRQIAEEIRDEAARQVRGISHDLTRQVTRGWGQELAHQLFGGPSRHRRRRHS